MVLTAVHRSVPFEAVRLVFAVMAGVSSVAPSRAETATVAVASNFLGAFERLEETFEGRTGHRVQVSAGSTGALYAQIKAGAPVDLFLAADSARPKALVSDGLGDAESVFIYAVGRLALWPSDADTERRLIEGRFRRLAIAQPAVAPYGAAAKRALQAIDLWATVESRVSYGLNVAQAFTFAWTGAADIAVISLAQVRGRDPTAAPWSSVRIPQGAILLKRGAENPAAEAFATFLKGPEARSILAEVGYETP